MTSSLVTIPESATALDNDRIILAERHAMLLTEITTRAHDVTAKANLGSWPNTELDRLLSYLQLTLLPQIADEDWQLFRWLHDDRTALETLRRGHQELRRQIELLARAARELQQRPRILSEIADRVVATVRHQFDKESRLLERAEIGTLDTAFDREMPYACNPIPSSRVIDLDLLPAPASVDALLERIMRLGPGEHLDVHASSDLSPLSRYLARVDPESYRDTPLENGPPRWRMRIVRRSPR